MDGPSSVEKKKLDQQHFYGSTGLMGVILLVGSYMYLLVKNHVDAMGPDIVCKLAQEIEDVFNNRCVWQAPESETVPDSARRGQERHCRQH